MSEPIKALRLKGMSERRFKYQRGDWVIVWSRFQSLGALTKPGKVVESDADGVVVAFGYDAGEEHEFFVGDAVSNLRRIRWVRQRGRSRWTPA